LREWLGDEDRYGREREERERRYAESKALRATGSTKLGEHASYKFYAEYYLAHSPRGSGRRHYIIPSDAEFAEALEWLGKEMGLYDMPTRPGTARRS
jgi:hypothetical protein